MKTKSINENGPIGPLGGPPRMYERGASPATRSGSDPKTKRLRFTSRKDISESGIVREVPKFFGGQTIVVLADLFSAVSDLVQSEVQAMLGFGFNELKALRNLNTLQGGIGFGKLGYLALCKTLGKIDGMEGQIHRNVRVVNRGSRMGDPITNGRNCSGGRNQPVTLPGSTIGLSYSVPDFIIGDKPVQDFVSRQYNQSFTVGEFKFSARTLYNDYVATGAKKPEQFDAVIAYAGDHTYLRTALFIVVRNGKNPKYGLTSGEMLQTKYMLGRKGLTRGVLPVMVVLFGK